MKIIKYYKHLTDKYGITLQDIYFAISYLKRYGYLDGKLEFNIDKLVGAVRLYQEFFHLKEDGEIGGKTIRAMRQPRCACVDIERMGAEQYRWNKKHITYYMANTLSEFTAEQQITVFEQAWQYWEDVCGIKVERTLVGANADIIISTGRGRRDNFDGASGTLAWAELPSGNRRLNSKFDEDETWVSGFGNSGRGIRLLNVSCHEFGHLLGLTHSKRQGALMAPYYSPNIAKPQPNDDISRIQAIYGKNTNPTPEPEQPTPEPQPPVPDDSLIIQVKGNIKDIVIPGYVIYKR